MELSHPDDALSALLGARVEDEHGRSLGRVRDVRAQRRPDGTIAVDALLVGRRTEVPWADAVAVRDGVVVVRARGDT